MRWDKIKQAGSKIWELALAVIEGLGWRESSKSVSRLMTWIATVVALGWAVAASVGLVATPVGYAWWLFGWLGLTLLLTVVCEAIAEGMAREQTKALRMTKDALSANVVEAPEENAPSRPYRASELTVGSLVIARAGDTIAADGIVVAGIATVDESALTGESAPVIRENSDERSTVTAGTRIISDWIIFRVSAAPGESFLDKMISMVEGTKRQRTPTEIAVDILLTMFTIIFAVVSITIAAMSQSWAKTQGIESPIGTLETVVLFLCLAPTTLSALLPIIGIAGMMRLIKHNIIAKSGQAVEAAGNIDVLMMDKTGTITLGNRVATALYTVADEKSFAKDVQLASLADTTPEGRSIVVLAKEKYGIRTPEVPPADLRWVMYSSNTRMSGVDLPNGRQLRKGAVSAIEIWLKNKNLAIPEVLKQRANQIATEGGTPLMVADEKGALGVIALSDIVKGGLKERFEELRRMGVRTVMITGDNPLTAAAVAASAGVDQFIAEATPQKKLELIRNLQAQGRTVAMTGDGTNDAPALAQADVALAMNSGTQPAKDAGNLIDLDNNPTKLLEVVRIGKQNLITIGALATFSLANDISKLFTVVPALLGGVFPQIKALDVLNFTSSTEAMKVALIFNAAIIPLLLPLALAGTPWRPMSPQKLLKRHLFIYGLGGVVTPFAIMKLLQIII